MVTVDMNRLESRRQHIMAVLANTGDAYRRLICRFELGCLSEELNDHRAALQHYREGIKLLPVRSEDARTYYLYNNAGLCLNRLQRYEDAEEHFRLAIRMNRIRPNAHENLGVSLERQGRYEEAGEAFIEATRLAPADNRTFARLRQLRADHPDIFGRCRHLQEGFQACSVLVANASAASFGDKRPGHA